MHGLFMLIKYKIVYLFIVPPFVKSKIHLNNCVSVQLYVVRFVWDGFGIKQKRWLIILLNFCFHKGTILRYIVFYINL